MKRAVGLFVLAFGTLAAAARGPAAAPAQKAPIVGVKIYEFAGDFPGLFREWRSMGINSAFVSAQLGANPEVKSLARKNGITTFLIFPVFFDAEELERRPDLYAIRADGTRAEDDWVKFACPTRPEYLARKIEELRRALREVDPDVLSLDFMRFFVFWEKVYPDRKIESLPDTCFDQSCLDAFERETNVRIPGNLSSVAEKAGWIHENRGREWIDWKCGVIARTVQALVREARRVKPSIRINIHTVPWRKDDFGGAGKAIAGQDLERLAPLVDYISPMAYHHMVRRTPAWVHSVTLDAYDRTRSRILPSIQVDKAYIEDPYPPADFKEALQEALKPPSAGVVFWSWEALSRSPERKDIVRSLLGGPSRTPK